VVCNRTVEKWQQQQQLSGNRMKNINLKKNCYVGFESNSFFPLPVGKRACNLPELEDDLCFYLLIIYLNETYELQ